MRLHVFALAALAVLASPLEPARAAENAVRPATMILQLGDLPRGFDLEGARVVTNAELTRSGVNKKDYGRLGRVTGYDASYSALAVSGLTAVDAFASVYKTSSGAHASLMLTVAQVRNRRGSTVEQLSAVRGPGNEALVYRATSKSGSVRVDQYTVAWRHGSVFAEVIGGGRAGTIDSTQIIALAKRQDARIAAALQR
jgi:hypothetical protein